MSRREDVYNSYKMQFRQMEKDYNKPYHHYRLYIAYEIVEWLDTHYYDKELLHLYEESNLSAMTEAIEEVYSNKVDDDYNILEVINNVLIEAHQEEKEDK